MPSALGIDLSDTDKPISQMVKVGIDDLAPTRVLRNCSHMYWTFSRQGHNFIQLMPARSCNFQRSRFWSLSTVGVGKVRGATL